MKQVGPEMLQPSEASGHPVPAHATSTLDSDLHVSYSYTCEIFMQRRAKIKS